MFRFEEPLYLYALFLVPLLAALHLYTNYIRRKRLRKFGDPALLADLMPDVSKYRPDVKFWLLLTAFALMIFVLARPQFGTKVETEKRKGIEAIIAMDVSNSMLAQDVKPSRLDKSKMLVSNMVNHMQDDKVGLVVYAGEAFTQLPITSDYVSAQMFLETISPDMIHTQGTDIKRAIELAMKSFTPAKGVGKAIFLITDGEDNEGGAVEAAQAAADKGMNVYVLGVGSPNGSPIPTADGGYITDNTGETVISHLNEDMCREIAKAGKGSYIYVDNSSSAQEALSQQLDKLEKADLESKIYSEYDEQFQAVAVLALLCLILEICILGRKNPLLKGIRLFGNKEK